MSRHRDPPANTTKLKFIGRYLVDKANLGAMLCVFS